MKPPQKSKYHRRALTREELALLGRRLKEAGPKDRAMVMLVLFNGFRPIDVVNLLVEDVDFSGARIRCRGSKGGPDDALPLSPTMTTALQFYLELTGIRSSWIFTGPKGKMATRSIGKAWHRVCGPALGGLVLYQLRHSYAMELLRTQEGITLVDLQKMLRHRDVRSTMWYVDSQDDRQQELMLSYDVALTAKLAG